MTAIANIDFASIHADFMNVAVEDMQPGDVTEYHESMVTILRGAEFAKDVLGQDIVQYWARHGEREGYISFGANTGLTWFVDRSEA
jgi:hypothetical protein